MNHERRIEELGARLERAVAADYRAEQASVAHPRRRWWRRRGSRWFGGLMITAAVAGPGVAWAAGAFTSARQEAASLPAAMLMFDGTHPTCAVVHPNREYHCTLTRSPELPPDLHLTHMQHVRLDHAGTAEERPILLRDEREHRRVPPSFLRRMEGHTEAADRWLLTVWGYSAAQVTAWIDARFFKTHVWHLAYSPTGHPTRKGAEVLTAVGHRVDGACRSLSVSGKVFQCYLGRAAVAQRLLLPRSLGQYLPPIQ